MQVFKYYKELIEFHKCGDPIFFMKCINPKEAQYIDYSSGLHIRFRLAGVFHIVWNNNKSYSTGIDGCSFEGQVSADNILQNIYSLANTSKIFLSLRDGYILRWTETVKA